MFSEQPEIERLMNLPEYSIEVFDKHDDYAKCIMKKYYIMENEIAFGFVIIMSIHNKELLEKFSTKLKQGCVSGTLSEILCRINGMTYWTHITYKNFENSDNGEFLMFAQSFWHDVPIKDKKLKIEINPHFIDGSSDYCLIIHD